MSPRIIHQRLEHQGSLLLSPSLYRTPHRSDPPDRNRDGARLSNESDHFLFDCWMLDRGCVRMRSSNRVTSVSVVTLYILSPLLTRPLFAVGYRTQKISDGRRVIWSSSINVCYPTSKVQPSYRTCAEGESTFAGRESPHEIGYSRECHGSLRLGSPPPEMRIARSLSRRIVCWSRAIY